jgi:molecular chaperone DnaJ
MRDYYAVLGVAITATPVQIRRAYQRLARRYSPDVNLWDGEAQTLFEEISQAYRVLSDVSARSLYDRQGSGRERGGPAAGRARGRRGDDLHVPVELSFAQAASGIVAELAVERLSPCAACEASGTRPGAPAQECGHCGGTGVIWRGEAMPRAETCPACEGGGARAIEPCPTCRGRGVHPAPAAVSVAIPAGVDTGAHIRVAGQGHAGPFGGRRGDLIAIARVHEDPVYTRRGDNIYCELPVSLVEAALGARIPVRTLRGVVDVVIPPGTQSGESVRLRGRGLPRLAADGRGDLYLTVRVEVPRALDARAQALVEELGRLLPAAPGAGPRSVRA